MILRDIVPVFALLLILSKSWTTNLGGKFQQSFSRSQNTAVALYLLSDTSGCVGVDPSNLWVLEKASSWIPWVPCGGCLRSVGYQYVFTGLSVHAQPHWEHGSNYWKQVRLVPDEYWILPRLPLVTDLVHTFADLQICSSDFFADDVVMLASLKGDLHLALGWFATRCKAAGMRVSTSISEVMVLSPNRVLLGRSCFPKWRSASILGSCSGVWKESSVRLKDELVQHLQWYGCGPVCCGKVRRQSCWFTVELHSQSHLWPWAVTKRINFLQRGLASYVRDEVQEELRVTSFPPHCKEPIEVVQASDDHLLETS